jgi:hypothetical protein
VFEGSQYVGHRDSKMRRLTASPSRFPARAGRRAKTGVLSALLGKAMMTIAPYVLGGLLLIAMGYCRSYSLGLGDKLRLGFGVGLPALALAIGLTPPIAGGP